MEKLRRKLRYIKINMSRKYRDKVKPALRRMRVNIKLFWRDFKRSWRTRARILSENGPQIYRMLRRVPIAMVILYLFLSSWFGSDTYGLGFKIVATLVIATLVAALFRIKLYAKIMNWPLYLYMGRNNFLYLWLVVFSVTSTAFCARTLPEPVEPLPNPPVVASSGLTNRDKEIAENLALVKQVKEKFANHKLRKGYVTNAQVATVARNQDSTRWRFQDRRYNIAWILWILVFAYFPFAFFDEVKGAVVAVAERWATKPEAYEKPAMYDWVRRMTGGKAPVWTAAAAAGTAVAANKAQGFWVQVIQEALAQKIVDIPQMLRRR